MILKQNITLDNSKKQIINKSKVLIGLPPLSAKECQLMNARMRFQGCIKAESARVYCSLSVE